MPPMTSTIRSLLSRICSKSPSLRRRTPVISGRMPVIASICAARAGSSSANAPPTVPRPSSPMRKTRSDIALEQVLGPFAPDDETGVAAGDEDHGRPGCAVVGVGHGEAAAAGRRRDDHVPHLRLGQMRILHDHVAGFAVLAHKLAWNAAVRRAVSGVGLVAGAG